MGDPGAVHGGGAAAATRVDPELLLAVFRFKHQRPSATQSESLCWRLRDALGKCIDETVVGNVNGNGGSHETDASTAHLDPEWDDRATPLDAFTTQERVWLRRGWTQLFGEPSHVAVGDVWTLQWFPAYGAVLQAERVGIAAVALRVLALDGWEWTRHFLASGDCVDSAVPTKHVVFSCGQIPTSLLGDAQAKIKDAMSAAAQLTGSQRSAASATASGVTGHQKTPQFLVASVWNVLDDLVETNTKNASRSGRMPRGGMTDVGLHTGGAARDTCWPLVCTALRQALPKFSVLIDKVLHVFHGWLIESELPVDGKRCFEKTSVQAFWRNIEECFEMLETVVDSASRLDAEGYDARGIVRNCENWRKRIDAVASEWSYQQADNYCLLPASREQRENPTTEYPKLAAPDQKPFALWQTKAKAVYANALTSGNCEYVLLEDDTPRSAISILVFLESIEPQHKTKALFGVRIIEKFLFKLATTLSGPISRDVLAECEPEPLLDMMAWYRDHALGELRHGSDDFQRVQRQSVYTVLAWAAFCLAHRHTCDTFADVGRHKIALDWQDLQVCVLHEASSRSALLHIVRYIHDWNARAESEALFDLVHQEGTLALARRMGQSVPIYQDIYLEAVSRLRLICESQWAGILARKRNLEVVRQEIASFTTTLNELKQHLAAAEEALRWEWKSRHPKGKPPRYLSNYQTQVFSEEIYRLADLLRQKTAFRDELVQMPEFTASPVPADQEQALQILFLLGPPKPIDILAALCWWAQRALTPPSSGRIESPLSESSWRSHVEGIVGELPFEDNAQYLAVFAGDMEVPPSFGPSTIDDVATAEMYTHSCVWYPSGSGTTVLWRDDACQDDKYVNPFQVDLSVSIQFFTPELPVVESPMHTDGNAKLEQSWRWVISYPGDSGPDRGNRTYAERSTSVEQEGNNEQCIAEFAILGSLRAYPTQQLRRIFASVAGDSLAWSNKLVETVLLQALYQVGVISVSAISDTLTSLFLWHQDIADERSVRHFSTALKRVIEQVKLSPRRWDCIPLLSEISAFLCQYDSDNAKHLLLVLARTARRWARETRDEWQQDSVLEEERRRLRSHECILYGYGVLCLDHHCAHQLFNVEEVEELCELLVLFHHTKLFAVGDSAAEVESLASRIERMMANRVVALVKAVDTSPYKLHLLTRLAKLVLPKTPDRVDWRLIQAGRSGGGMSCCFIGVNDNDGSTCVVNLFSGAVTSSGGHPTSLPQSIRCLPQYQTLFQEREFEVLYAKGVYETTAHNNSLQYRFCVFPENPTELVVEEAGPDYTLQSCTITWTDQLQRVLPTRLAKLYSHWYWMKRQIVLLRGLRASDAGVYYVMRFDVDGTTRCYEVPRQDRFVKYSLLIKRLREYPMLVVGDAKVVATLSKFEEAQYIHTLRQPQPPHALEVSLPRFGLRFVRDADGRLASLSHRGYVLSEHQQLAGQMLRFRQYLLLDNCESESDNPRLLVPMGPVRASENDCEAGLVGIRVSTDPAASLSFLSIDQHPRLEVFTPETIEARLQLAGIYAASGTRLPCPQLRMTGGETALQMLRGCVPSRQFSSVACEHLMTIASHFAYRTPVLAIVVGLLLDKSQRLACLFDEQPSTCPTVQYADALDEYRHQHGSPHTSRRVPVRQRLTHTELCDIVGSVAAAELVPARTFLRRGRIVDIEFDDDFSYQHCVKKWHDMASVASPLTSSSSHEEEAAPVPPFPLSPHGSNMMSMCMLEDLRESWNTYHRHSRHAASTHVSAGAVREGARRLRCQVTAECQRLQQTLREVLRRSRTSVCDRLATTVSRLLDLTFADVMRSVVDEAFLLQVAPFPRSDRNRWKAVCIRLLEMCVLEDKLERISLGGLDSDVQDELRTATRAWDPNEHPYWLVFEVESRVQIRHEQYVIAKHLLDNPGSICQLNMGRGKTRVILPMLFLYFSFTTRSKCSSSLDKLTRAHFLSPLLSETRELMWKVLTSSVLALPFVELPYNRSCSLTPDDVAMIRHVLSEAKRHGAVLMVAPEHRLSLELERVELQHRQDEEVTDHIVDALGEILDPTDFIDVFDESDALLHHGYHLIYAVGASKALDGGATRWIMAEALLRVLVSSRSKRVQQTLQRYPDAWSIQPEYKKRFGGERDGDTSIYKGFRLHTASSTETNGEQMRVALRAALAEDLMDDPPFELEWLRIFGSRAGGVRKSLVRLLTDVSVDAIEAMQRLPPAILHVKDYVLALRGLLAFKVLETCLQKRYRVEYGHPPAASRQKAIAIPFQAADLPAERSEFSHPDVGITLTLLAFYHSGLRDAQVRQAFKVLLSLDESESRRYYDEWFGSIASQIENHEDRETLASLQHISTDNAHQFVVVCRAFRFAMEVINFYVNFCVFPSDTRQFPHRLSRSAWDLVRGQRNIGFSGTKDTHYLLPHGVEQHEPDEPVLRGTNGKMVQLLLDATRGYEALSGSGQDSLEQQTSSQAVACWQSLLLRAVEKHTHALIDTGALLAGVSNHEAATFLVAHAAFAFQGVTYYDTRPQFDAWVVLEKDRDLIHHHKNSPLRESDTFVIFDEARARGSDMKLSHQAVALLTLGPSITKDKLMQGAGRMRLLGTRQQTVWLTSTQDVYKSVAFQAGSTKPIDVVAVLNWVMDNTQRQCTLGLLEWAQSGIQFHTKQAESAHELQDDDWTLQGQYGAAQTQRLIAEIIQSKLDKQSDLLQGRYGGTAEVMAHVQRHGETFGRQDAVHVANFDEECEREVQIEEEQQETREHSRHHVGPCFERAWNWRSLLYADSVNSLRAHGDVGIDILSLENAVRAWLVPMTCGELDWGATKIFATTNFWSTVAVVENAESTDHSGSRFVWTSCMREVHSLVVFADSSILMLSEFEENAVLAMLYAAASTASTGTVRDETSIDTPTTDASGARGCFGVVHLPFAVNYIERLDTTYSPSASRNTLRVLLRDVPLATGWNKGHVAVATRLVVPLVAVIACCLLNGDTELFVGRHAAAAESALRTLLANVRHREETLQTFISLRGFTGRWKRSSLHAIARRMDLEDAMRPANTVKPKDQAKTNKATPKKKRGKKSVR